ncbi:MAG: sensor histidine kinase [Nocardioidaceae bacterium]
MNPTVRRQHWLQHLIGGLLLSVCLVRAAPAVVSDGLTATLTLGALVFLLLTSYTVGLGILRRTSASKQGAAIWLGVLSANWLALVLVSSEFIWLAFVLWLLAGHLLGLRAGVTFCLFILLLSIAIPWQQHGQPHAAAIIGPSVGMLFAFGVSRGQMQLLRLTQELSQAQHEAGAMAERTRLARDIHDTLAQGFASILILSRAGQAATTDRERLLGQIEQTAADNLEESRRIVAALAPAALEDEKLAAALKRLAARLEDETQIKTEVTTPYGEDLTIEQEIALLRVAQSALANVRQHARAQRVWISLDRQDDRVRMIVKDDGIGIDPATRHDSESGFGLAAMRSRLLELGGDLSIINSKPGTTLTASLPTEVRQ